MDDIEVEFEGGNVGTSLAVVPDASSTPPPNLAVFGTDDPVEVIPKATRVADALKAVIVSKGLAKRLGSRTAEYVEIGGWQTCGAMLGIFPFVEWTRKTEDGWESRCVVRRGGVDIGAAEAQCTRLEQNWKTRDDYALRSMAQTRATSKALRSVLGFIMVLAGYRDTPAEEVPAEPRESQAKPKGNRFAGIFAQISELVKHDPEAAPLKTDEGRHNAVKKLYGVESFHDLTDDDAADFSARLKSRIQKAKGANHGLP